MSGTRRSAWRTIPPGMLLALQLVVAPASLHAQDAVDTTPPPAATEAAPDTPEAAPLAEPISAEVVSTPVPSGTTPVATPTRSRLAPYALWGTSAVSLAVGTAFGIMALSAKNDFNDGPTYKRADKVHNLGIAADTGLGLGVLLAITGTVFYFVTPASDTPSHGQAAQARPRAHTSKTVLTELRLAPLLSQRVQGGTLSLRF